MVADWGIRHFWFMVSMICVTKTGGLACYWWNVTMS